MLKSRNPFSSMLVFQRMSCSCGSCSDSVMMTRSSTYMFSQGHSGERASRTQMNSTGSAKSPGKHQISHRTHHSDCYRHALCFWHFHTCSARTAPATQHQACEDCTRWNIWVHDRVPFPDRQRPCTLSCWRHINFHVTALQWVWRMWFCIQEWSHRGSLVVGSSQTPSPEPSSNWDLGNFLVEGDDGTLTLFSRGLPGMHHILD